MTQFTLLRGVWAETLKMKRSLALIVALLLPLFPAFVNVAETLRTGLARATDDVEILSPWALYLRSAINLWVILAMPIVVAILSALLANVDHKPKAWKMLFALPLPRGAIFAGKWASLVGITFLSMGVFVLANAVGGSLIQFLRPELGLGFPIPLREVVSKPLLGWLLSLFMLTIHLWISLRWPSFLVSIAVGFAGAVSNIFLIASYLYSKSLVSPWAMPAQAYGEWRAVLVASLIGTVCTYFLARQDFVRRDVY